MNSEKKLSGLNVILFESRHAKTLADLVALQGGKPFSAPTMKEVPLENNPEVFQFAEKWISSEKDRSIDILILLTGVGTRALMEILETKYSREKILDAFRKTMLVPRGPKSIRVLKEWGIPHAVTVPEPNTWRILLETLDLHNNKIPLSGKTVAIQEYGVANKELVLGLEARGAKVLSVPVYRWTLPDDLEPIKQAISQILNGEAQVAMFTTAVQIKHLLQVAEQVGADIRDALNKMVVASVGPDCSEALRLHGVSVDIEPESPKMGPLVLATAERAVEILQKKNQVVGSQVSVVREQGNTNMLTTSATSNLLHNSLFLKACRREKTSRVPVWLMRQAGRYMKDYRQLREKHSFLELCRNSALVAEVTVSAQEKIKADAAILFSDILLLVEPLGLKLDYVKGDGPSIQKPLHTSKDVDLLKEVDPETSLSFVLEGVRQTRRCLGATIPLIGFAGAPFTVASYMIEGGSSKDFSRTKHFMREDISRWKMLMQKITRSTVKYLNAQIAAGAQALQLFDSWAGVLTPEEYRDFAAPFSKELLVGIRPGVSVIHFGTKTAPFLETFSEAGGQVIGVDHRIGLSEAWKRIGPEKAIQGNLDPEILLKDKSLIKKEVDRVLAEVGGRPGYIFNLGHGVLPDTPLENVIALIDMVHEYNG